MSKPWWKLYLWHIVVGIREGLILDQNHQFGPITDSERIKQIDILRGFALCGILIINIGFFAYPQQIQFDPTMMGGFDGIDFWVWRLKSWFFFQKMMAIFSMLFGAGLVVMATRAEAAGKPFRKVYVRRTLWLAVFGLLHAYLFWYGDILFSYGICGLVVFLFRRKSPKTLIVISGAFFAVGIMILLGSGAMFGFMRDSAETAAELKEMGEEPTHLQASMLEAWTEIEKDLRPNREGLKEPLEVYRDGSIGEIFAFRAKQSLIMQTQVFIFMVFWQVAGLMLLGMALLKAKIITGDRSTAFYVWMAAIGLTAGLGMSILSTETHLKSGFEIVEYFAASGPLMVIGSIGAALGYIGLIMLILKTNVRGFLKDRFAALGRMALTNYLLQTIICTTIFYGYGFGLFGRVNRAPAMLVVFGVWIIQLLYSKWWLQKFHFGPAEWLWRTLTYLKRQPFRKVPA